MAVLLAAWTLLFSCLILMPLELKEWVLCTGLGVEVWVWV